ncbi:MAG: cell division protein ZapA [Bacteroidales bacterium]|nr:cell division protein ZapA [Bacteroidales bacterium]
MDTNQNIKLTIAGRPYRMSVNREEEQIVRRASESLNKTIIAYSKSFEYKDSQDLFAMIALQSVANSIRLEDEKSFRERELEDKLLEIDTLLVSHIEKA